ncbi:MAG: hypothetical protein ACREAD_04665 [Nitrosopumilaceae archaeon]
MSAIRWAVIMICLMIGAALFGWYVGASYDSSHTHTVINATSSQTAFNSFSSQTTNQKP